MTDTVTAALIGVGGTVIVAVASVVTQLRITRAVIGAERERITQQLVGEEKSRRRERREERIVDAVAELLSNSDPQIAPGVDYGKAVTQIHRIQLLLNLGVPAEKALNGAVNTLGQRLQEYHFVQTRPLDQKLPETKRLLEAQGAVSELTRDVLTGSAVAAT